MSPTSYALIFTFFIGVVILFQLALAIGMPWGSLAMGGKFPGKYPVSMRISCLPTILILMAMTLIVLSRAGLALPQWRSFADVAIWFVAGYAALGTFLNLITKSVWERRIWAPVSFILCVTCVLVALS